MFPTNLGCTSSTRLQDDGCGQLIYDFVWKKNHLSSQSEDLSSLVYPTAPRNDTVVYRNLSFAKGRLQLVRNGAAVQLPVPRRVRLHPAEQWEVW